MANEIQRALNVLGSTLVGGALALSKGLGKQQDKSTKKEKTKKAKSESFNPNSLNYLTQSNILSSDEAAERAYAMANNAILEKARAKNLRDAKTGKFVKRDTAKTGSEAKFTTGGNK